jgi:riboflavin biosynthesis pyrimidine reductase
VRILTVASDTQSMRQLLADETRPTVPDRPWVMTDMVTALDGSVSVAGRTKSLSNEGDRAHFRALREITDSILVGTVTANGERYRTPKLLPDVQAQRVANGQRPDPRLVVVGTRGLDHEVDADVITIKDGDIVGLIADIASKYGPVILCEGGPTLLTALAAAGVVDEWFVTVSPLLGGSAHKGIVGMLPNPAQLELDRIAECEGYLLLRYLQAHGGQN